MDHCSEIGFWLVVIVVIVLLSSQFSSIPSVGVVSLSLTSSTLLNMVQCMIQLVAYTTAVHPGFSLTMVVYYRHYEYQLSISIIIIHVYVDNECKALLTFPV